MIDKYCVECGKELIKDFIKWYDRQTGEPVYHMVCPSGICKHTGCNHRFVSIGFFKTKQKCTLCGHVEYTSQDYGPFP